MKVFGLALLMALLASGQRPNYCASNICSGQTHICCNFKDKFALHCPRGIQLYKVTPAAAQLMVDEHNKIRDYVASGRHDKLEKASRIPELRWFEELAYISECHVESCMKGFDKCRNTLKFKNVGQNIFRGSDIQKLSVESLFARALTKWTKDAMFPSLAHLNKFNAAPVIGNFTQIIHETAYKFGCGASWWITNDRYEYEVVCNYNDGNTRGRKIYLAGDANCSSGSSPKYPHLCSIYEPPVLRDCSLAKI